MEAEPTSSTWAAAGVERAAASPRLAPVVWSLAWPVIATFALDSLVGLVDTLMVGRLGASAVAAVGVGTQIMGAVAVAMTACGTGTLALVARHVGARERGAAEHVLAQSILAALGLSVLAITPVLAFAPAIVGAFGVEPDVVGLGVPFVRVAMLSVPAGAVLFVVGAALRAAGDTRTPLAIGAVVNAVNVVGNWVLIFGRLGLPALGVVGSALATTLAFLTGAALGVALLVRGRLRLRLPWRRRAFRPDAGVVRRLLAVGAPTAVEQLLMQVGFFLYLIVASDYGTSAVAAYFIGVRILALSFLPGLGFSAAAATLVGQHLGAGEPERAEHSGWEASRLALVMMSVAGLCIFAAARPIARAFVDDPAVVDAAVSFIRVLAAAQPLMAMDYAFAGALRGAGDTRFPLLAVLVGFYGCRLGVAWLVSRGLGLGLFWVWFALLGDYLARVVLKGLRFRSGRWKLVAV